MEILWFISIWRIGSFYNQPYTKRTKIIKKYRTYKTKRLKLDCWANAFYVDTYTYFALLCLIEAIGDTMPRYFTIEWIVEAYFHLYYSCFAWNSLSFKRELNLFYTFHHYFLSSFRFYFYVSFCTWWTFTKMYVKRQMHAHTHNTSTKYSNWSFVA